MYSHFTTDPFLFLNPARHRESGVARQRFLASPLGSESKTGPKAQQIRRNSGSPRPLCIPFSASTLSAFRRFPPFFISNFPLPISFPFVSNFEIRISNLPPSSEVGLHPIPPAPLPGLPLITPRTDHGDEPTKISIDHHAGQRRMRENCEGVFVMNVRRNIVFTMWDRK